MNYYEMQCKRKLKVKKEKNIKCKRTDDEQELKQCGINGRMEEHK